MYLKSYKLTFVPRNFRNINLSKEHIFAYELIFTINTVDSKSEIIILRRSDYLRREINLKNKIFLVNIEHIRQKWNNYTGSSISTSDKHWLWKLILSVNLPPETWPMKTAKNQLYIKQCSCCLDYNGIFNLSFGCSVVIFTPRDNNKYRSVSNKTIEPRLFW